MKNNIYFNVSRSFLVTFAIIFSTLLFPISCAEDEDPPEPGVVEADVPEFAVVNVPVTVLDRSNNAASRTWTIQDGSPATSTDRSASVTFSSAGTKSVTLEVVFENGTTNSETFSMEVAEELNASFTATETQTILESDAEYAVTFTSTVVGEPDSYLWSFPGGTPETSTEANPTVVWAGGGMAEVSLTITRSVDGASLEVSEGLQVGPDNLWTDAFWGFEGEGVAEAIQTWNGAVNEPWAPGVIASINDAYEGKGIEVNFGGNDVYYGMISRDNKVANATEGALKLGDIVLFSYYVKSNTDGAVLTYGRFVNHAPSWWEDGPPLGWEGFTAAQAQDFQDFAFTQPTCTTDWQRVAVVDTLDNLNYAEAINVFPEFGFENQDPAVYSLDKVELKLLGNVND